VAALFSRHSLSNSLLSSRQRDNTRLRPHLWQINSCQVSWSSANTALEMSLVSSTTAQRIIRTVCPYWSVDICGMISRMDLIMAFLSFAVP
jgi:hypothetical protein